MNHKPAMRKPLQENRRTRALLHSLESASTYPQRESRVCEKCPSRKTSVVKPHMYRRRRESVRCVPGERRRQNQSGQTRSVHQSIVGINHVERVLVRKAPPDRLRNRKNPLPAGKRGNEEEPKNMSVAPRAHCQTNTGQNRKERSLPSNKGSFKEDSLGHHDGA